jgi:hypothetical protein
MTARDFEERIKKPYKTDNTMNYIVCLFLIAVGLFFLGKIIRDIDSFPYLAKFLVFILPLIFIIAGAYGIWRLRNTYRVQQIDSTESLEKKAQAVEKYLNQLKIERKRQDGNFISFRYRNKYLTSIDANVYYDNDKILYYAEGADLSGIRGIIDFGISKRATNRIGKYFKACL